MPFIAVYDEYPCPKTYDAAVKFDTDGGATPP